MSMNEQLLLTAQTNILIANLVLAESRSIFKNVGSFVQSRRMKGILGTSCISPFQGRVTLLGARGACTKNRVVLRLFWFPNSKKKLHNSII